ncbi:MAG: LVIVD repeat-containing protein, partial [Limisphaerales bacterium]
IDISNPTNLVKVGQYDTQSIATCVEVNGNYAYVADSWDGFYIIDVSNPSNPVKISIRDTPDRAYSVKVSGDYAFIADWYSGLEIYNISNPAVPVLVGTCDTPGGARNVELFGNYAFIADYEGGLRVINIKDFSKPVDINLLINGYTNCLTHSSVVSGDYIYVADLNWGLLIFHILPPIIAIRDIKMENGLLNFIFYADSINTNTITVEGISILGTQRSWETITNVNITTIGDKTFKSQLQPAGNQRFYRVRARE